MKKLSAGLALAFAGLIGARAGAGGIIYVDDGAPPKWVGRWSDLADFEITPVLSSDQAKARILGAAGHDAQGRRRSSSLGIMSARARW